MNKSGLAARLNRRLGTIVFILTVLLASFLRFFSLNSLPPGLHPSEAGWVRLAMLVSQDHKFGYLYKGANTAFSAYIAAEALLFSVAKSITGLRAFNAALGVVLVVGVYFWTKDWFGRRAGLLASFVVAVSPWAITVSRNNWPINAALAILAWLAYCAGRAYKTRGWGFMAASCGLVVLGCYSARIFWIVPVIGLVLGLVILLKHRAAASLNRIVLIGLVVGLLLLVPLAFSSLLGRGNPADGLVHDVSVSSGSVATRTKLVLDNAGKTALMFFAYGDEDYSRNLGALPLLNSFVGLMLLLGLLVSWQNRRELRYKALMAGLGVPLLGATLAGGSLMPDSYRAGMAMPFVFVLSGVGINYLLKRWYGIFPINTTARTLGLSFVCGLLLLSLYQGYRQYFVAWAQDPQTYVAYREDLYCLGGALRNGHESSFVVAPAADLTTISSSAQLTELRPEAGGIEDLEAMPLSRKPALVYVVSSPSADSIKRRVVTKFPGGSFRDVNSGFDGRALYSVYTVK